LLLFAYAAAVAAIHTGGINDFFLKFKVLDSVVFSSNRLRLYRRSCFILFDFLKGSMPFDKSWCILW
jgi:hypothetical protein